MERLERVAPRVHGRSFLQCDKSSSICLQSPSPFVVPKTIRLFLEWYFSQIVDHRVALSNRTVQLCDQTHYGVVA